MEYSGNHYSLSQKLSEEHGESQDHLASDTTDDEQEDLPYDGILECYLVPSLQQDKVDQTSAPFDPHQGQNSSEESPIQTETTNDKALYSLESSDLFSLSETASNPMTEANKDIEQESETLLTIPTRIPDVLLRHISEGNLLNPSEFIDYETMPEISMVESSDETTINRKHDAKIEQCLYDDQQEDFKEEYLETYCKENNDIQEDNQDMANGSNSDIDETSTKENDDRSEQEIVEEDEIPPESKQPTYEPYRRPSYEMKYGQGQVHYKLPDFSKVPPKVKIPKGDNNAAKQGHTIKKAAPSAHLIGQSFLIQDILESMQPGHMKKDTPFFDHRYEQALVDTDFNSNVNPMSPAASECFPSSPCQFPAHLEHQSEVASLRLRDNVLKLSSSEEAIIEEPQNLECARVQTEGEKMTRLLMEQTQNLRTKSFFRSVSKALCGSKTSGEKSSACRSFFSTSYEDSRMATKQTPLQSVGSVWLHSGQVESFSDSLLKKSLPRREQLLVFQNFRLCLETLEIDYLSTKEKHRDLQLQIYRTGSQTVGEFDSEREVEGQIFRLGMLLEDIQEQINKSEESETESAASTTSGEAPILSPTQEAEDIKDLPTISDKELTWSPNTAPVSERQIQEESPVETEAIPSLRSLCLHPVPSTGIVVHGKDPGLNDHRTVNRVHQLAREEASGTSDDIAPLTRSGQPCELMAQNSFSQVECPEDWILVEHSESVEERQITEKLKKDIGGPPLYIRYQKDDMRKTQGNFRTPRNLSIFVQEKALNLDLGHCNGTQHSLNSEWLMSSNSGLFQCRSKSPISDKPHLYKASSSLFWKKSSNGRVRTAERHSKLPNPETVMKEYPNQKSLWSSKLPLCAQNQSSLHHIRNNISHYIPSSRSSGQSSVSHHAVLANSTISALQRKRWKNIKPNNLDYRDNMILNYVLDNALRTAKNMQKTTERMVQKLATDLVNPSSHRSSFSM